MRKEFLVMMTFYIAGLVFVNYAEPAVDSEGEYFFEE